jgi:hypothetical protein
LALCRLSHGIPVVKLSITAIVIVLLLVALELWLGRDDDGQ